MRYSQYVSRDAAWTINGGGTLLECNDAACALTVYDHEEVCGMHIAIGEQLPNQKAVGSLPTSYGTEEAAFHGAANVKTGP